MQVSSFGGWLCCYLKDCVADINEAEDGGKKGREFTQGDDSHKKQNYRQDQ